MSEIASGKLVKHLWIRHGRRSWRVGRPLRYCESGGIVCQWQDGLISPVWQRFEFIDHPRPEENNIMDLAGTVKLTPEELEEIEESE